VIALSWQLDHVGTLTRSVADAWLLWQIMRHCGAAADAGTIATLAPRKPAAIWRVRDFFESEADPQMLSALDDCCQKLAAEGVGIIEKRLPAFARDGMLTAHRMLMASDAAAFHRENYEAEPGRYPPRIGELIAEGLGNRAIDYSVARQQRTQLMAAMNTALSGIDAAIMPAATGPAPPGLAYTGDRLFNVLSSFCGLPVVSLPVALSQQGLPLGMQLLGGTAGEDDLLAYGSWCEKILPFVHKPG
jgi:Asp-tRNA(Asn)/Glu-tRNA(Gln) amidotransferase A subunit family amidase